MGYWLDFAAPSGMMIPDATPTKEGFMSAQDKQGLNSAITILGLGPYQSSAHIAAVIARGGSQPSYTSGNFTNGMWFYFTTPGTLLGVKFFFPLAGVGQTVRIKLWKNGIAVETHNINPVSGVNTLSWDAPIAATAYDRYCISSFVSTAVNSFFAGASYFNALGPSGPLPQSGSPAGFLAIGVMIEAWFVQSAGGGDSFPSSTVGGWAMIDPLFTVP